MVLGGVYPGSTSRAAYSVPIWVGLRHVESCWMGVNGVFEKGWTHHVPLLANRTTFCPAALVPVTRPAIRSILAAPPDATSGTSVNSMEGVMAFREEWQPLQTVKRRKIRAKTVARDAPGNGIMTCDSEVCLESNLYLPRLIGLRGDPAKSGISHSGIGTGELHAIKSIEGFEPYFQPGPLPER